jgi:hypothetical protein
MIFLTTTVANFLLWTFRDGHLCLLVLLDLLLVLVDTWSIIKRQSPMDGTMIFFFQREGPQEQTVQWLCQPEIIDTRIRTRVPSKLILSLPKKRHIKRKIKAATTLSLPIWRGESDRHILSLPKKRHIKRKIKAAATLSSPMEGSVR